MTSLPKYTDSLDDALKALVSGIYARHTQSMRTHVFSGIQAEAGNIEWREAWYSPKTGWSVEHNTAWRSQKGGAFADDDIDSKKIASGVCFFDALHALATFDAALIYAQRAQCAGDELPSYIDTQHHREAAKKEGIPFDHNDMPVPAADGRPLVSSKMSAEQRVIAKLSQGNIAHDNVSMPVNMGFLENLPDGMSRDELQQRLSSGADKPVIAQKFADANAAATAYIHAVEKLCDARYRKSTIKESFWARQDMAFACGMTLGAAYPFMRRKLRRYYPYDNLKFASSVFNKAVHSLPESPLKAEYKRFGAEIMLGNFMAYSIHLHGSPKNANEMKASVKKIGEFAKAAGYPEKTIQILQLAATEGQLSGAYDIWSRLKEHNEKLRKAASGTDFKGQLALAYTKTPALPRLGGGNYSEM